MNLLAKADLETARAMLARVVLELEMHAFSEEDAKLRAAQGSWDEYAAAEPHTAPRGVAAEQHIRLFTCQSLSS